MSDRNKLKKFVCDSCPRDFYSKALFHIHSVTHLIENAFECDICQLGFSQIFNLDDHFEIHKIQNTFICPVCEKEFFSKTVFDGHLGRHNRSVILEVHSITEKEFEESDGRVSPVCLANKEISEVKKSGEIPISEEYSKNDGNEKSNMQTLFCCGVCQKFFADSSTLDVHLQFHKIETVFSCSICLRKFTKKSALDKHLKMHNNKEVNVSQQAITKKNILSEPDKIDQNIIRTVTLHEISNEELSLNNQQHVLQDSVQDENSNMRTIFCCGVCQKCFADSSTLDVHLQFHKIETVFSCSICQRKFTEKSVLDKHLKMHSSKEIAVHQQSFPTKIAVGEHVKINQSFNTAGTSSKFTKKSALDKHLKMHNIKEVSVSQQAIAKKNILNEHDKIDQNIIKAGTLHEMSHEVITLSNQHGLHDNVQGGINNTKINESNIANKHNNQVMYNDYQEFSEKITSHESSEVCNLEFLEKKALDDHFATHNKKAIFSCGVCQKYFPDSSTLDAHLQFHKIETIFTCSICQRKFTEKSVLYKHLKMHSSKEVAVHQQVFPTKIAPGEHVKINQSINTAGTSSERSNEKLSLSNQQNNVQLFSKMYNKKLSVNNQKNNVQPYSEMSNEKLSLSNQQNILSDTPQKEMSDMPINESDKISTAKEYSKDDSNKTELEKYLLAKHNFAHSNETPSHYCQGELANKNTADWHENHDSVQSYSEISKEKLSLNIQQNILGENVQKEINDTAVNKSDKISVVEEYSKSDSNKTELEKYLLDKHSNKTPSNCCQEKQVNKTTADEHENHHNQEIPNECQKISDKVPVKPPESTFNYETIFACCVCHLEFSEKIALDDHFGTHNIKTIFGCSVCPKYFADSSALDNHLQFHTTKTIFTCSVCQKKFTEKPTLEKHLKMHSSNEIIAHQQIFAEKNVQSEDGKIIQNINTDGRSSEMSNEELSLNNQLNKVQPYCCKFCPKKCATVSQLKKHSYIHKSCKKVFLCGYCKKQYPKKYLVKRHIEYAHSEKKFSCEICQKKFSTESRLSKHMENIHDKIFVCDICQKKFKTNDQLFNHVHMHAVVKSFECTVCHKTFRHERLLREHAIVHNGEKPYVCDICEKRYARKSTLYIHRRYHTGNKRFVCELCEKAYYKRSELTQHLNTHKGVKPYSCNVCGQIFSSSNTLSRHRSIHSGEKPYLCNVCGKAFSHRPYLNLHLVNVHSQNKKHECEVCGKGFLYQSLLLNHLRKHTGEKPFLCETCGKNFANKTVLNAHVRLHTGEKPFVCETCAKKFVSKSHLNAHMRVHQPKSSIQSVVCELCNKKVSNKGSLKKHYYNKHNGGEKPFVCNVCKKGFLEKRKLDDHLRLHSGEKPFPCEYCGKLFINKHNMQYHIKHIHLNVPVRKHKRKNTSELTT